MIFPVQCFTCGKLIGDQYLYYLEEVNRRKLAKQMDVNKVEYLTPDNMDKTINGEVLDELRLTRLCCRRHFMTHVDIR